MDEDQDRVEVRVSGAVVHMGRHAMSRPATIWAAIEAAGGLARRPTMWAAGPISVRRRLGQGQVQAWRFHLDEPSAWQSFEFEPNDLLVVQWHIADGPPADYNKAVE